MTPARYRDVWRTREMPAVLTAHAVSLTGSVAAEVALSVLVYRRTSSPLLSALTLGAAFVPQAFSAVLLSGLADRVPPRRLLVACDLLSALVITGMVLPGTPVAGLLLLAAVNGLVAPLFGGARGATLADLVDGPTWVLARSALRIISQSSLLLGFAAGGVALTLVTPRTLLVLDALSFLASAALLRFGTSARPARASVPRESPAGSVRAVWQVLQVAPLRRVLLLTWLPSTCFSTVDALATPYAAGRHAGPQAIGLLLGCAAAGGVLSELLAARLRLDVRPRLLLPVASLTGLLLLVYAFRPPVGIAALLNVGAGLGFAVPQTLDGRLLTLLPPELRGRVLSLQSGLLMAIQGVGIAVAGAVAEVLPPHVVLAGAGVLDLLVVWALLSPRKVAEPVTAGV